MVGEDPSCWEEVDALILVDREFALLRRCLTNPAPDKEASSSGTLPVVAVTSIVYPPTADL